MARIEFDGVSKFFARHVQRKLLRGYLHGLLARQRTENFRALDRVTFRIDRGESVALVGANGAGKSTLLSLVAGISSPNEGRVRVEGKVAALLDLGSGFHPELTGRENIHLNGALLGLKRREVEAKEESIIAFAGLSDFIDEPLKTYSSGMAMRLAFAVAIELDPDILIVDEVLAVGDQAFQDKCLAKVRQLVDAGKTMLAVSHSPAMIRALCRRAIWLDHGRLMMDGAMEDVIAAYEAKQRS
ncbi:MAG: ABC transporter ATP-binding protein [Bryobacterales bacterium]|nr:ABC transporter ATP-binding protein [Bryobacterales bacterium]